MELILRATNRRTKQSVSQDHYWYDSVQKKMLHGHGGRMEFRYDPKQKRSLPHIEDNEQLAYVNNFDKIAEWVEQNNFSISDQARGHFISIEIPASDFVDVTMKLYRHGILFDYNQNDIKKELQHVQT